MSCPTLKSTVLERGVVSHEDDLLKHGGGGGVYWTVSTVAIHETMHGHNAVQLKVMSSNMLLTLVALLKGWVLA